MNTSLITTVVLALGLGVCACGGEEPSATAPASPAVETAPSGSSAQGLRGVPRDVAYTCGDGGAFDEAGTCPSGTFCSGGECVPRETEGGGGHGDGRGGHGGG